MTVKQLIDSLTKATNPDNIVRIWDPDAEEWMPVTGYTYAGCDNFVDLYSDED